MKHHNNKAWLIVQQFLKQVTALLFKLCVAYQPLCISN